LQTLRSWRHDRLLRGIIKNSGYLFSSNSAALAFSMVQGVLAARLLGVEAYGILAGVVIPFASNIHRFLSFRMSELVVKYLNQFLIEGKRNQAAALVKWAALVESITSLVAYSVLFLLVPVMARNFAKDPETAPWFAVYGLVLVSHAVFETSRGVLQSSRMFKQLALVNFIQSIITTSIILWAFLAQQGLWEVLLAYLIGKTFTGIVVALLAFRQLSIVLGKSWLHASLSSLPNKREMARFAVSTNLQETINLIARDSETLLISFLRSPLEAGYYRIAMTAINLLLLPIDPLISTTYAEISRTVSNRHWDVTRRLLKRVSIISGIWTLGAAGLLTLTGWWLIPFIYGADFAPGYPAMVILLVGYGVANTFNWNRPLLLALGMPAYPLKASAIAGAIKTILTFAFVGTFGYIFQAVLLSGYFVSSVGAILWRGLSEINRREAVPADVALSNLP
jgi:O-antigen/teichoic acid export membrane protein